MSYFFLNTLRFAAIDGLHFFLSDLQEGKSITNSNLFKKVTALAILIESVINSYIISVTSINYPNREDLQSP
jgi:hypothetical protein